MYDEENKEFDRTEGSAQEEIKEEVKKEEIIDGTAEEKTETAEAETKAEEDAKDESMAERAEEAKAEEKAETKPNHKECYYKETVKHSKKKSSFKRFIAACMVVSLCGGIGVGGSYSLVQNYLNNKNAAQAESSQTGTEQTADGSSSKGNVSLLSSGNGDDAVSVIDKVYPSVVNINTSVHTTANYYGMAVPYDSNGAGSGVIFNEDDQYVYIVTNNHVVADASTISVSVTGKETLEASLVGTDSTADIAVVKVLKSAFKDAGVEYKVADFGDSDKLKVGESVIAIGNALGEGKSATGGMVSVLNKTIEVSNQALNVIQTSAAINPGNSGGALVNYDGQIIGINTAKTSTSVAEGMGYAIPSNTANEIMNKILTDGTTPKPYLGIMGSDITDELSQMYKLPVGVLVRQVLDGGAAQKAGVQEGDIITSFNGKTVMNMEALQNALKDAEVGSTVEMSIIRNGDEPMTLNVTVLDANQQ